VVARSAASGNGRSELSVVRRGRAGRPAQQALGIDVGGTGVKAALVNLADGSLASQRVRFDTPEPSKPAAVVATIAQVVSAVADEVRLPAGMPIGCGVPGVVKGGRLLTAANIDKGWLKVSAAELIGEALGRRVHLLNDADAAGIAEMEFGAGRDHHGTVLMLTIGTGIGSGLFLDGRLVPNTELGHLEVDGRDAETRLSGAARERRGLKWPRWATEFNDYLARVEAYLWPDLIILGGGVSKSFAKYDQWLTARAPIVAAQFLNSAGIVGAALYAARVEAALGRPAAAHRPVAVG
jgi:polyphosphate glucokinase